MIEKSLGVFDGADEGSRVELVQVAQAGERVQLELRMQRECEGLGWTTQRRITLAPGQWGALKDALMMADLDVREDAQPSQHQAPTHLRLIG